MKNVQSEVNPEEGREAIDAYFECVTYCSLDDKGNDCRTVCMEKHLKNYF